MTDTERLKIAIAALEKCAEGYAFLTTLLGADQIRQAGKLVSKKCLTVETAAGEKVARDAIAAVTTPAAE